MLLLSTSLLVPLDVLNNRSEAIARFDANLLHLHGDCAVLTLPAQASLSLVHWGTQVRFWISDGPHGYEVEGVVTARDTDSPAGRAPQSSLGIAGQETDSVEISPIREIVVRLWKCLPFEERRTNRRRWTRFSVRLHPLPESKSVSAGQALENITVVAAESACWERGWAVDISGGGMRLRTYACLPVRQRLVAQFWLPNKNQDHAASHAHCFALNGRVLRSEKARTRTADMYETMLSFEHLSTEDGLALSHFLTM
jgi:hypothetical protein